MDKKAKHVYNNNFFLFFQLFSLITIHWKWIVADVIYSRPQSRLALLTPKAWARWLRGPRDYGNELELELEMKHCSIAGVLT